MSHDSSPNDAGVAGDESSRPQIHCIDNDGRRVQVYYDASQRRLGIHSQETPPPPVRESAADEAADPEAEKMESLERIMRLAEKIPQAKLNEMLLYYNGSVSGDQMCQSNDSLGFLNTLVRNDKLSATKLIYLQVLFWKTKQRPLFDDLTGIGRLYKSRGLQMEYFSRPTMEPVNAFRHIHLHLTSAFNAEVVLRQREQLSRYLNVPLECIVLAGATPSNSFWLTLLIPEDAFSAFLEEALNGDVKPWLKESKVTKISFLQDILPTDMEEMIEAEEAPQSRDIQEADKGAENSGLDADVVFGKKTGYWLTLQMPGDVHSRLLDSVLSEDAVAIMAADVDKISFLSSPPQSLSADASQNEAENRSSEMTSQSENGACGSSTHGFDTGDSSEQFDDQESAESENDMSAASDTGLSSDDSFLATRARTERTGQQATAQPRKSTPSTSENFDTMYSRGKVYVVPYLFKSKVRSFRALKTEEEKRIRAQNIGEKDCSPVSKAIESKVDDRAMPVYEVKDSEVKDPTVERKLKAEECKHMVLTLMKQALEEITEDDDPPAFVFHDQKLCRIHMDVFALHYRVGVLVLKVITTDDEAVLANTEDAVRKLRRAKESVEEGSKSLLGEHAVTLAIAAANIQLGQSDGWRSMMKAEDIHVLFGSNLERYKEWVNSLKQKRKTPVFPSSSKADSYQIFKQVVCKYCTLPRYDRELKRYSDRHAAWILTPEQMALRNSEDEFVHVWGPPGAGRSLLLIERARRWLQMGRQVVLAVGSDSMYVCLAHLQAAVLGGDGDYLESQLTVCSGQDSLLTFLSRSNVEVSVVVREPHPDFYHETDEYIKAGKVKALWTAGDEDLPNPASEAACKPKVQRMELTYSLRCPGPIVTLINTLSSSAKPGSQVKSYPIARALAFQMEPLKIFHNVKGDGKHEGKFHTCPECRRSLLQELSALGLAHPEAETEHQLQPGDCVVLVAGDGNADVRDDLVRWLKDLGLPVEREPQFESAPTEKSRLELGALVASGRDASGSSVAYVLKTASFRGMERRIVLLFHHDGEDTATRGRSEKKVKARAEKHRRQWLEAATACQGKLIMLVATPSPLLRTLEVDPTPGD